ncbi:MAG: hypothetical protein ACO0C9_03980 [Candidatus Methanosuratincola verstraetei]
MITGAFRGERLTTGTGATPPSSLKCGAGSKPTRLRPEPQVHRAGPGKLLDLYGTLSAHLYGTGFTLM